MRKEQWASEMIIPVLPWAVSSCLTGGERARGQPRCTSTPCDGKRVWCGSSVVGHVETDVRREIVAIVGGGVGLGKPTPREGVYQPGLNAAAWSLTAIWEQESVPPCSPGR